MEHNSSTYERYRGYKKVKKEQRNGKEGFFKDIMIEIRDSILFELVLNILTFIPRMIVRLVKNLF